MNGRAVAGPRFVMARWDGRVWRLQSWCHDTRESAEDMGEHFRQNAERFGRSYRYAVAEIPDAAAILAEPRTGHLPRVKLLVAAKEAARAIPKPS